MSSESESTTHEPPQSVLKRPCMFCDGVADLFARPSLYEGVTEITVRCPKCQVEFVAKFWTKVWARIMKAHSLAQLGGGT